MWINRRVAFCVLLFLFYNALLYAYIHLDWREDSSSTTLKPSQIEPTYEPLQLPSPPPPPSPPPKKLATKDNQSANWNCEVPNDGQPHLVKLPITFEESMIRTPLLCDEDNKPIHLTFEQIHSLRSRRYYIAVNLYQNADVSPHLYTQMLKVMHFLSKRPHSYDNLDDKDMCIEKSAPTYENIFVSIYESGSSDDTQLLGAYFEEKLRRLGVEHQIILGATDITSHRDDQQINRIDFMAAIRNRAMEPLYTNLDNQYDKVLFLNDVYFCWQDAVRLLSYDEIDMACGLDVGWRDDFNTFGFYDTWVAKDKTGNFINFLSPFLQQPEDQDRLLQGLPVPMYCCWNGMTALNAAPFYPPHNIRFRRSQHYNPREEDPNEACDGAECSVLCFDFFKHNFMNIIIDPHSIVTYESGTFRKSVKVRNWPNDNSDRKINDADLVPYKATITPAHEIPFPDAKPEGEWCCPVPVYNHGMRYFDCYWRRHSFNHNFTK